MQRGFRVLNQMFIMKIFGLKLKRLTTMNRTELREKVYQGVKLAIDKLIEERAKEDGYLIISRDDKIVRVPAKELLKEMEKENSNSK